jgi:hypothetical protein
MFYYLANPYGGSDELRKERFEKCCKAISILLRNDIKTISPVVHNHSMTEVAKDWTLEERQALLLPFDFSLLEHASGMILLTLDGWEESFGVKEEIKFCEGRGIKIYKITYDEIINDIDKLKSLLQG